VDGDDLMLVLDDGLAEDLMAEARCRLKRVLRAAYCRFKRVFLKGPLIGTGRRTAACRRAFPS